MGERNKCDQCGADLSNTLLAASIKDGKSLLCFNCAVYLERSGTIFRKFKSLRIAVRVFAFFQLLGWIVFICLFIKVLGVSSG